MVGKETKILGCLKIWVGTFNLVNHIHGSRGSAPRALAPRVYAPRGSSSRGSADTTLPRRKPECRNSDPRRQPTAGIQQAGRIAPGYRHRGSKAPDKGIYSAPLILRVPRSDRRPIWMAGLPVLLCRVGAALAEFRGTRGNFI